MNASMPGCSRPVPVKLRYRFIPAMLGALPADRHKMPMCCPGDGAKERAALVTPWNMKAPLPVF